MFYITAGVTAQEPWQTKGGTCSTSQGGVTAQEPWQTKGGTCSTSQRASQPKSPGRLRAAHVRHFHQEDTCHGRRALRRHMFYITAGVTAQEPWQIKGGARPPHPHHSGRHMFYTTASKIPIADLKRRTSTTSTRRAHVTAQEPWQTQGGTCSTSQRPRAL